MIPSKNFAAASEAVSKQRVHFELSFFGAPHPVLDNVEVPQQHIDAMPRRTAALHRHS